MSWKATLLLLLCCACEDGVLNARSRHKYGPNEGYSRSRRRSYGSHSGKNNIQIGDLHTTFKDVHININLPSAGGYDQNQLISSKLDALDGLSNALQQLIAQGIQVNAQKVIDQVVSSPQAVQAIQNEPEIKDPETTLSETVADLDRLSSQLSAFKRTEEPQVMPATTPEPTVVASAAHEQDGYAYNAHPPHDPAPYHVPEVEELTKHPEYLSEVDDMGNTPLMYAIQESLQSPDSTMLPIFTAILEKRGEIQKALTKRNLAGQSALDVARSYVQKALYPFRPELKYGYIPHSASSSVSSPASRPAQEEKPEVVLSHAASDTQAVQEVMPLKEVSPVKKITPVKELVSIPEPVVAQTIVQSTPIPEPIAFVPEPEPLIYSPDSEKVNALQEKIDALEDKMHTLMTKRTEEPEAKIVEVAELPKTPIEKIKHALEENDLHVDRLLQNPEAYRLTDEDGNTPLLLAIQEADKDPKHLILRRMLNSLEQHGRKFFNEAISHQNDVGQTAIALSKALGLSDVVELIKSYQPKIRPIPTDVLDQSDTMPSMIPAQSYSKLLVSSNESEPEDEDNEDEDGGSELQVTSPASEQQLPTLEKIRVALQDQDYRIEQLLLQSPEALSLRDEQGNSPLMMAVQESYQDPQCKIVRMMLRLLESKGESHLQLALLHRNAQGKNAFDLAQSLEQEDLLELLRPKEITAAPADADEGEAEEKVENKTVFQSFGETMSGFAARVKEMGSNLYSRLLRMFHFA